jgi:outer membrane protein assembly factor BamA
MPIGFRFDTKLVHDKDASYYGIGIGSSKNNDAKYLVDAIYTGGAATFEPVDKLVLNLGFFFLADQTGPGENPSVQTVFPPDQLVGFGRDIIYFTPGISAVYDWRDATGRPEKGGLYRGVFARFHGLGVNGFDFNLYSIELEQFIKLWLPRHVLALRTAWQYRQPTGGGEVPFSHLSRLDVYSPLRGFGWGRFRDRGSMVFNVEYRFPVWAFMDGALFFDSGRVFHTMSDISFKHMKFSGGGGLRVTTKNYFLFRIEVAYGGEGVRAMFKTSQAF